jgi:hypothetical protein
MHRRTIIPFALACLAAAPPPAFAAGSEQAADPAYRPVVVDPTFPVGTGPVICVDQAHHNFHRIDGRFGPFATLAGADGFRVEPSTATFESGVPAHCAVLVIANAQPDDRDWQEYVYPTPSAFSTHEIDALRDWVWAGGRLLLIADHMPLAGAAGELAAAFDCRFLDGFVVADFADEEEARANFQRPTIFSATYGSLRPGPGTSGRSASRTVTSVATFIGQAFQCGAAAQPLLVLPPDNVALMPRKAWQFTLDTARIPVGGWLQGAALEVGRGRVALFGEAAMFTAQIAGDGRPMGMNAPGAEQNASFVLNLLEWLAAL